MEVQIIPKEKNIPDYDPPYSSYEEEEITEEVISKILKEITQGLNIYLYLEPYEEVDQLEVTCDGEWLAIGLGLHGGIQSLCQMLLSTL